MNLKGKVLRTPRTCLLCHTKEKDTVKLGELYKIKEVVVHYYCLLLSHRAKQRGEDHEGINGFLYADIKCEIDRCKKMVCKFCKKTGASVRCQTSMCRVKFHLPCGVKNNCLSHFFGDFASYCSKHRPVIQIPLNIAALARRTPPVCSVCLEEVNADDPYNTLWSPCCKRSFHHRTCLSTLALSFGSLFKCPICSDLDIFKKTMLNYGLYIPERDASWEYEANAFHELQFRYNSCDAYTCICPLGNQHDDAGTVWEIIICSTCGSKGTHVKCGRLKFHGSVWTCNDCEVVINNDSESHNSSQSESSSPRRTVRKCPTPGIVGGSELLDIEDSSDSTTSTRVESPNALQIDSVLSLSEPSLGTSNDPMLIDIVPGLKRIDSMSATSSDPLELTTPPPALRFRNSPRMLHEKIKRYIQLEGKLYELIKLENECILLKPTSAELEPDTPVSKPKIFSEVTEDEPSRNMLNINGSSDYEVVASCRKSTWFVPNAGEKKTEFGSSSTQDLRKDGAEPTPWADSTTSSHSGTPVEETNLRTSSLALPQRQPNESPNARSPRNSMPTPSCSEQRIFGLFSGDRATSSPSSTYVRNSPSPALQSKTPEQDLRLSKDNSILIIDDDCIVLD